MRAKVFEFVSYRFDHKKGQIFFNYKIGFKNEKPMFFTEKIFLPKKPVLKNVPRKLLDRALSDLHIVLGISYYKLYCPPKIKLKRKLSKNQAEFWNTVYERGLGEFFFQNKINFRGLINFPSHKKASFEPLNFPRKNRALLGIGGGKDSLVAAELLRRTKTSTDAFVVETNKGNSLTDTLIEKIGIDSLAVERKLDEKILKTLPGAYNGHVPISAIFAFLGYLLAVLYDYRYIIVANEQSSNFGNVKYLGKDINHQWSKSSEFEDLFQKYTKEFLSPDITYFSMLRPYHEIRIAEMFSRERKYFPFFTSCNRNFLITKDRPQTLWCGECPKCAFAFTIFSAFLSKKDLVGIFGNNLYDDEKLAQLFADILGYGKMKPFDCVGTFEESRAALYHAKEKFKNSLMVKKFLPKIKNPEKLVAEVFRFNAAPTLPPQFVFSGLKNVAIVGYGREGKASEKYLKKRFSDLRIKILDEATDIKYLEKQNDFDFALKTPGLPKEKMTIPYTTATNLFFSQIDNLTIGVTGSKGKSTTASLIYSILKAAGKKVTLLGNIGSPMLSVLERPITPDEIFVLELSSYQLDDICYSPDIAVILNLFPEHMNYHGNAGKYYVAKKNIVNFQKPWNYFVYNGKDKELKKWTKDSRAEGVSFSDQNIPAGLKSSLLGRHNEENIQAAVSVAKILKIPQKAVKKALAEFKTLPHRLELVGKFRGIEFYDDAISTTPESTLAALYAIPNVATIFLGGEDRGYDFSKLEKELKKRKIKNIVLFPESGKRIIRNKKGFNILETTNMSEAVNFAFKNTPAGKICLLSMASPSYSLWKNFEEKGDEFQRAIRKLG